MILLFWQITGANLTRGKRDAHKHFIIFFFRFSALRSQRMRLIVDEQPSTCRPSAAGARIRIPPSRSRLWLENPPLPNPGKRNLKLNWFGAVVSWNVIAFFSFCLPACYSPLNCAPSQSHCHTWELLSKRISEDSVPQRNLLLKKGCYVSSPRTTSPNTSWLPLMLPRVFLLTVAWIMQGCSPLWPCVPCFGVFERDYRRREVFPDAIFLVL